MNIDLVYYFRQVNNFYYLNGPEKVNGNIVNNSPAYQLSSASEVMTKINQMIASLSPDITNAVLITSDLYTGNIQINTYSGELQSGSDVPDYTGILTSINTNLTNLNGKFVNNSNVNISRILESIFISINDSAVTDPVQDRRNNSYIKSLNNKFTFDNTNICKALIRIFDCINIGQVSSSQSSIKSNSYIRFLTALSAFGLGSDDVGISDNSNFKNIWRTLRQSVSPNANITDVISALNTNIHNDLTELNTTTNNKDTVLIVDGQQDFVIRKQNKDDYDS